MSKADGDLGGRVEEMTRLCGYLSPKSVAIMVSMKAHRQSTQAAYQVAREEYENFVCEWTLKHHLSVTLSVLGTSLVDYFEEYIKAEKEVDHAKAIEAIAIYERFVIRDIIRGQ